jgi:peroxiredoxin
MKSRLGEVAVPFELLEVEGNTHRSSDFAGRWLLLVFHRHLG